jgi:hypothetical protein
VRFLRSLPSIHSSLTRSSWLQSLRALPVVVVLALGPSAMAVPASLCWSHVSSPNGTETLPNYLNAVDGASANDVWAVGSNQIGLGSEALIEHWDGAAWSMNAQIQIGSGDTNLYAVDAVASSDVWAVGLYDTVNPLIEHWDGTGWFISATPIPGATNVLFAISAVSASDIWAVGQYSMGSLPNLNLAFHYDGTSWTQFSVPSPGTLSNQLNGVSAVSANDVWAVGSYLNDDNISHPLTVHWNGVRWSIVPNPAAGHQVLTAVTAVSSSDVWAVGWGLEPPLSIHWDGALWTVVTMPKVGTEDIIHGVDASSSTDVWAGGEVTPNSEDWRALAMRWNGSRWVVAKIRQIPALDTHFLGVAVVAPGNVWGVGYWEAAPDATFTEHTTGC